MDIFEKIFGKIHNFLEGKLDKQTYTYPQDNRLSLLAKILFKKNYETSLKIILFEVNLKDNPLMSINTTK